MSTATKAQHTVPQSYLRRFTSTPAVQKQGKMMIWVFDKTTGQARQQKIRNAGFENKFYDFIRPDGVESSIENVLAEIENPFNLAIEAICSKPSKQMMLAHQVPLAHFVICQLLRTTSFRQQMRDMTTAMRAVFEREGSRVPAEFTADENDHAFFQTHFLVKQMPPLAAMLLDKAWMVMVNDTGTPFWTSDHPVFMHNRFQDPYRSTLGIACPGIEIYTPLSPRLTLLIFDPVQWLPMYSVSPALPTNINFVNAQQVAWSQRHIYASTGDFTLATQVLSQTPEFADPNRPRVNVG